MSNNARPEIKQYRLVSGPPNRLLGSSMIGEPKFDITITSTPAEIQANTGRWRFTFDLRQNDREIDLAFNNPHVVFGTFDDFIEALFVSRTHRLFSSCIAAKSRQQQYITVVKF